MPLSKKIFFDNDITESRSNATPRCPNNHQGVTSNHDSLMSEQFFFSMASRSCDLMQLLNVQKIIEESHQIATPWCLIFFLFFFFDNGIKESWSNVTPQCLNNHRGVASNRDSLMSDLFFISPIMASRSHDLMQLLNSWTRFLFGHRGVALDCDSPMPLLKKNYSDIMESRSNATPWCLNQVFVETLKTT
jgi:hypothetical protein